MPDKKSNKDIRHDIRSALTPIIGYSELLLSKLATAEYDSDAFGKVENAKLKNKLEKIRNQAYKINDLLDVMKENDTD